MVRQRLSVSLGLCCRLSLAVIASIGATCSEEDGDASDDSFLAGGKADSTIAEGSCSATGVLRLVDQTATDALRKGAKLSPRAANGIAAFRVGDDGVAGTADDRLFMTLAELDGVPYVGPATFKQLLAYAEAQGLTSCPQVPAERRDLSAYVCPPAGTGIKVAFFDADSTLRVSRSGAVTANNGKDVYLLPWVASNIARLNRDGYLVAIVSNQLGISQGRVSAAEAEAALVFTAERISLLGGKVDYIDFAEFDDAKRKPATGMALQLAGLLEETCACSVALAQSMMIGDSAYKKGEDGPSPDGRPADDFSNADRLFAENLGIAFYEPTDFFGWREFDVFNVAKKSQLIAFLGAVDAAASKLRSSGDDPDRLTLLVDEVVSNRLVNGLP